ncbi:MAG: cob(I)yrinic acid a,c-diamide adenosyltransferase [Candidatus Komeilibacteria bacterium]
MVKNLGQIQIYTGDCKGKTTASLGLAMRARGRGFKVAVVFFDKGDFDYGERNSLEKLGIDFWVTGCVRFDSIKKEFRFGVEDEDIAEGAKGLVIFRQLLKEQKYDIVILDEINSSLALGIVNQEKFLEIMAEKPKNVELILTGRNAPPEIIELANLVTEMKMIKHYFYQGVEAREGIEY